MGRDLSPNDVARLGLERAHARQDILTALEWALRLVHGTYSRVDAVTAKRASVVAARLEAVAASRNPLASGDTRLPAARPPLDESPVPAARTWVLGAPTFKAAGRPCACCGATIASEPLPSHFPVHGMAWNRAPGWSARRLGQRWGDYLCYLCTSGCAGFALEAE